MKIVAPLFVAAGIACATLVPSQAEAQAVTSPAAAARVQTSDGWPVDRRLLVVGAGAVMGVVAFNILAAPLGTVPLVAGAALDPVPYSVALGSRLIAGVTAGTGALGATWLYDKWTGTQSNYGYLLALGAGALAGVAAGNYLAMGMVGSPPYYVGAGAANAAGVMASSAAQAASRVYVIGSGVLGAFVADYLYRR